MKLFVACLTFIVFLASANAQDDRPGTCPEVKLQEDLDLKRFMGNWYKQPSYQPLGDSQLCVVIYNDLKNDTLNYTRTKVDRKVLKSVTNHIKYLGCSKFELLFDGFKIVENVLATDYENYLIMYSCRIVGDSREAFVDIFTRKLKTSHKVMMAARDKIAEADFPLEPLSVTEPNDCFM